MTPAEIAAGLSEAGGRAIRHLDAQWTAGPSLPATVIDCLSGGPKKLPHVRIENDLGIRHSSAIALKVAVHDLFDRDEAFIVVVLPIR